MGQVVVHNNTRQELSVCLKRPEKVWHLGVVAALADATLPIPPEVRPEAGSFRLVAWKMSGPFLLSDSFPLLRGATTEWTIGPDAKRSYTVALR
jgi:hypothetical protein